MVKQKPTFSNFAEIFSILTNKFSCPPPPPPAHSKFEGERMGVSWWLSPKLLVKHQKKRADPKVAIHFINSRKTIFFSMIHSTTIWDNVKSWRTSIFPTKYQVTSQKFSQVGLLGWVSSLVGAFNPIWIICSSNWIISPQHGVNTEQLQYLKPPPSLTV